MLSPKMLDAMHDHISKEFYSAYLYMAMSAYCDSIGLKGFAKWFMVQYHEEMAHTMRVYEYIQKQGNKVKLLNIDEPPSSWKSPLDVFENALKHEQMVSKRILSLMDLASTEKDHASKIFLQWYVTEQVEEEESVNNVVSQLRLIGDNAQALFLLDKDLSARTVNIPLDFSLGVDAQMKVAGKIQA